MQKEAIEQNREWSAIVKKLEERFGEGLDFDSILFLIGVQELGFGPKKFSKRQKLEVLHVAICTLLEPYGYYLYEGNDADGWPHFKTVEELPHLTPIQQHKLIKEAIIDYFKQNDLL